MISLLGKSMEIVNDHTNFNGLIDSSRDMVSSFFRVQKASGIRFFVSLDVIVTVNDVKTFGFICYFYQLG